MASIKNLKRMCKTYNHCSNCPLSRKYASCLPMSLADNADEIVDKWVAEHPVKTYAMDFFEKFPNALRDENRVPEACLRDIYGFGTHCIGFNHCRECWNREMKEGAKNDL